MSHENWSLYFIDLFTNNSTRQQEGNKYNLDFFLKKLAHAYFERRIFLSLLAGNFATFERILLTEKLMHEY